MYELRIRNRCTFGRTTIQGDTIQEIKNKLKELYIDTCGTVKLYEVKEIPIDSDWYERINRSKVTFKEEIYSKLLYEESCISKKHCVERKK